VALARIGTVVALQYILNRALNVSATECPQWHCSVYLIGLSVALYWHCSMCLIGHSVALALSGTVVALQYILNRALSVSATKCLQWHCRV